MISKKTYVILSILGVVISLASGQNTEIFRPDTNHKKTIDAIEITNSIDIDGLLNEVDWTLAKPSPRFIQIEPHQGDQPSFDTYVKALYNKQYLYFGIQSKDTAGRHSFRAIDFKRDFNFMAHDLITLTVDGFNDKRNAMAFATNPYGVQRDYLSFDDVLFDIEWDGLWKVKTTRSDSGWIAEIAIPWQTLRYKKTKDSIQAWGLNVYRNRRLTNEVSALSPFPRVFSAARMEYAGSLNNLKPPPPKTNIRLQPYILLSKDRNVDGSNTTRFKPGGDIKWAVNPNTVADVTFNTDFAQADVDLQVNNISRFSVFFPEKRQFFLENASLFSPAIKIAADGSGGQMHMQPFFSRSIGLDNDGNPIPIVAGGRFVNRSIHRNYGGMMMRQEGNQSQSATNFFVGRFSQNIGDQNRIGSLLSIKNTVSGTNTTATLDGFLRINEAQSINAIMSYTHTSDRALNGFAGIAQYYNSTNHYKIWWTQSVVSKDFDPQMGFISRTDVIGTTPGLNYYYRGKLLPFKKIIRAFEPGFLPEFYWQTSSGKLIERTLNLWPIWLNFQNGAQFGYSVLPEYQKLLTAFTPLGLSIRPGEYNYFQQWIIFNTDPSKFINLAVDYRWGEYFNGKIRSADWKLQFAPIPHISLLGEWNRNHFIQVGETLTTSVVDLYIVQGRFAINPKLQMTGFYQRNSFDKSKSYYFRFSWEYAPLSYVHLIFNQGKMESVLHPVNNENHFIAKISWLKQL